MQPNEVDEPTDYVTAAGWRNRAGRADLIDDVADQFERPPAAPWPGGSSEETRWPRASRGWRSADRMHASTAPAGRPSLSR